MLLLFWRHPAQAVPIPTIGGATRRAPEEQRMNLQADIRQNRPAATRPAQIITDRR